MDLAGLKEFFGGGLSGAIAAVLLLGCAILFRALQKSQAAHLETALRLGPIADKLAEQVRINSEQLRKSTEILERASTLFEAALSRLQASAAGRARVQNQPTKPRPGGLP